MTYLWLKWVHVLSATFMFGTGLGSAYYQWTACRSGNVGAMAFVLRQVVLADWLFTVPSVILQPVTGFGMVGILHYPLTSRWLLGSMVLYVVAGLCWLPAAWLQVKMRDMAASAAASGQSLPARFHRYASIWFWLGIPAFAAMVAIYFLMVMKPV